MADLTTHKNIMISGCGRSGTRYITFVLRRLGMDVGHERIGNDGIASWCTAVETEALPWGESIKNVTFNKIFHQVRHPLKVIPSVCTFKENSWQLICNYIPCSMDEPVMLRSAKYWYYWNIEAEKMAEWRYRIEEFSDVFDEFCWRLNVPIDRSALESVPTDINTRRHGYLVHFYDEFLERLSVNRKFLFRNALKKKSTDVDKQTFTWESLKAIDPELCRKIREKALEYGYDE